MRGSGTFTICCVTFLVVCFAVPAYGQSKTPSGAGCESNGSLRISPNFANVMAGATQRFTLFDNSGHNLTYLAEWSIDDPHVADLTIEHDIPVLTGKETGRVRLSARVGSDRGEANINVVAPEDLRSGKIAAEWLAPPTTCPQTDGAAQRVPSVPPLRPCTASELEFIVAPRFANLPIGHTQRFKLLDAVGQDITSQAEWSVDNSYVAELSVEDGIPVVAGKESGTARLTVKVRSAVREVIVNVFRSEDLMSGKAQLTPPPPPCARSIGTIRPLPPEALPAPPPNATKPQ